MYNWGISTLHAFQVLEFLRALQMSTGENAIEESVIDLGSCLTNSYNLEVSTPVKQVY